MCMVTQTGASCAHKCHCRIVGHACFERGSWMEDTGADRTACESPRCYGVAVSGAAQGIARHLQCRRMAITQCSVCCLIQASRSTSRRKFGLTAAARVLCSGTGTIADQHGFRIPPHMTRSSSMPWTSTPTNLTVKIRWSTGRRAPRNMCTRRACSCFCIESPTTKTRTLLLWRWCSTCTEQQVSQIVRET